MQQPDPMCTWARCGARVASPRCPILRSGVNTTAPPETYLQPFFEQPNLNLAQAPKGGTMYLRYSYFLKVFSCVEGMA
jgi:hypothetical protein